MKVFPCTCTQVSYYAKNFLSTGKLQDKCLLDTDCHSIMNHTQCQANRCLCTLGYIPENETYCRPREFILLKHVKHLEQLLMKGHDVQEYLDVDGNYYNNILSCSSSSTVLPAKSDIYFMFRLQSYQGLIVDISLVYLSHPQDRINAQVIYRFELAQVKCTLYIVLYLAIVNKVLRHCHS